MFFLWEHIPVIRITIPFLVGIGIGIFWPHEFFIGSSFIVGILFILFWVSQNRNFKIRWIPGLFLTLLFIALGFLTLQLKLFIDQINHFDRYEADYYILRLKEPCKAKENSMKAVCDVLSAGSKNSYHKTTGKLLVYFKKSPKSKKLEYGDHIIYRGDFHKIEPPHNPYQFNFSKFMSYKQIYHQAYLTDDSWRFTGKNSGFLLWQLLYKIRKTILGYLNEAIDGKDEYAVASALIVGYKSHLSDELRQSYASTGAMHVLAVSGLHVGVIFLIFSFLLKPLLAVRNGKIIRGILLICIIWGYAMLTGLSPSVVRAATMFSFIVIGQMMKRLTSTYSAIFTSAFLLVALDPFIITQVGFQLSYAAVIGIVYFQPKFYHLLPEIRNVVLDKAWAITCVSIAAQIVTFPLVLLYFNQFPVYFLLSNLFVIPAAMGIIYLGFTYVFLKAVALDFIAKYVGIALNAFIYSLNHLIYFVRDMPSSLVNGVYISNKDCLLIYSFILALAIAFVYRKKFFLWGAITGAMIICFSFGYRKLTNEKAFKVTIFSVPHSTFITFSNGNECALIGNQKAINDDDILTYNLNRYLWHNGFRKNDLEICGIDSLCNLDLDYADVSNHIISFRGKRFLLLSDKEIVKAMPQNVYVDYVILCQSPDLKLQKLLSKVNYKKIIIDASNDPWVVKKWEKEAENHDLSFYDVSKEGAFVYRF